MLLRTLCLALAALAIPLISAAEKPLLVYERTHAQVAHEDNTIRLELFDDHVKVHYPFYSPRTGYTRKVTPEERDALLAIASDIAELDQQRMLSGIDEQRSLNATAISDTDPVTIEVRDSSRGLQRISVPSPEAWQRSRPDDDELAAFVRAARELAAWMRENTGEETP